MISPRRENCGWTLQSTPATSHECPTKLIRNRVETIEHTCVDKPQRMGAWIKSTRHRETKQNKREADLHQQCLKNKMTSMCLLSLQGDVTCSFCHLYFVKEFARFGRKISAKIG